MDRKSPVPLWAVLTVGVVVVGGIYVVGKPRIAPQAGAAISRRPTKTPLASADSADLKPLSSSMLITDEYSAIESHARAVIGYAELRLFTADHAHFEDLYFFSADRRQPQSLLTIRYDTATRKIAHEASINTDREDSFQPINLSGISVGLAEAERISRGAAAEFLAQHQNAALLRSQLFNRRGQGLHWDVIWAVADDGPRAVISIDPVSGSVTGNQLLNP